WDWRIGRPGTSVLWKRIPKNSCKMVLTKEEDKVFKVNPEHTKTNETKGQCCLVGR
ncbi:hypothetical protein U1Q18_025741, partial [Sarracenia purpurea var. burkii]